MGSAKGTPLQSRHAESRRRADWTQAQQRATVAQHLELGVDTFADLTSGAGGQTLVIFPAAPAT